MLSASESGLEPLIANVPPGDRTEQSHPRGRDRVEAA